MKKILIQTAIFLSLISLNSSILYGDIIRYPSGDVYDGKVKRKFFIFGEKVPTRKGKYIWADGSSHEGSFKNGLPNGFGKHIYTDKSSHEGYFINDVPNGFGKRIWADGSSYEGNWINGSANGFGKHIYVNRDVYSYEGDWFNGIQHGEGKLTYINDFTIKCHFVNGKLISNKHMISNVGIKKPLNIESSNEGKIDEIEYFYEDNNSNRIIINYNKINKALNRNEINKTEDLRKYIRILDNKNSEIKDQEYNIKKLIRQLAQYQTQNAMKSSNGKLDNEDNINNAGYVGMKYSIILSEFVDDIEALKRVRFEVLQNKSEWPNNIYQTKESYLNSFGLTMNNNLSKNSDLTPIDTLIANGVDYFSVNIATAATAHAASDIIDLEKLKNNEQYFIYGYDTSGIMDGDNNAGGLQENYLLFNHAQQRLCSCSYNSIFSTITGAKYPEIVRAIRNGEIKPIEGYNKWVSINNDFNNFENLQKITIQRVSEHLGVGVLKVEIEGRETDEEIERGTKMLHLIVGKDVREAIKNYSNNKYFKEHKHLNFLIGQKFGTFESLLAIANNEGFDVEGFGPKVEKLLLLQTIAEYFGIGETTEKEEFNINIKKGVKVMHITADKDIKYNFKNYTDNNYFKEHLKLLKGKKSDVKGLSLTITNREKFEPEDLISEIKELLPSEAKEKLSYSMKDVEASDGE